MKFIQAVRQLQRHYEREKELKETELQECWGYIERPSLPVISTLPFDALPDRIRKHRDMNRYSLNNCVEDTNISTNLSLDVAMCSIALQFRAVFLYPNSPNHMDASAIYLNNELIGVLKHYEHPTFLALATVRDETKYPLVAGGVYAVPSDLITECQDKGRHHSLDLESLTVRPKGMLYRQTSDIRDFVKHIKGTRRKVLRERK